MSGTVSPPMKPVLGGNTVKIHRRFRPRILVIAVYIMCLSVPLAAFADNPAPTVPDNVVNIDNAVTTPGPVVPNVVVTLSDSPQALFMWRNNPGQAAEVDNANIVVANFLMFTELTADASVDAQSAENNEANHILMRHNNVLNWTIATSTAQPHAPRLTP